jgi:L-histidine N-alpha-methyltransferase
VRLGLVGANKRLASKWLLQARDADTFGQIIALPEYYLTRRERAILWTFGSEIPRLAHATTLIELQPRCAELSSKLRELVHPATQISINTSLHDAVAEIPDDDHRIVTALGNSIGELEPDARVEFLTSLAMTLRSGEHLLLTADLVKDPERLVAACDDRQGVIADLNLGLLERMNRELGARFPRNRFRHVARWDPEVEQVELLLRSMQDQLVPIPGADIVASFERGEEFRTAIHATFRRERLTSEVRACGFDPIAWWTDPAGDVSLSLWSRV